MLLASPSLSVTLFEQLDQLPPFNPDQVPNPPEVDRWRDALNGSAALIVSTPEYAHGIPGTLKNALDWIVGSGELSGKPAVLLNASARAEFAQASLREVLTTMNARLLSKAETTVQLLGSAIGPEQIAADPAMRSTILAFLKRLESSLEP